MTRTRLHPDHPLLVRIRSEFCEMPGLCLTTAQASRQWSLDPQITAMALEMLVSGGSLERTADGRFIGRGDGRRPWTEVPSFG